MEWMAWTLPTALFFAAVGVLAAVPPLLNRRRTLRSVPVRPDPAA